MATETRIKKSFLFFLLLFFLFIQIESKLFTLKGDALWPTKEQIQEFSKSLTVSLITDEDFSYSAPYTYNLRTGKPRPSFIVKPINDEDIIKSIQFAQRHSIRISIKSTGHHQDMRNTADQSLQLDMINYNHKSIDLVSKTITVGPGQPFADIHTFVNQQGKGSLVALSGAEPGVGPAGWSLGGGHGRLTRLYGLGVDALLSIDIIIANGTKITASSEMNSDLFWALRGSGASTYGVITSLTFKIFDDPGTVFEFIGYFYTSTELANKYQNWMKSAPNYVSAYYITAIDKDNNPYAVVQAQCYGSSSNCNLAFEDLLKIPNCISIESTNCKINQAYSSFNSFLMKTKDMRDSGGYAPLYLVSTAFDLLNDGEMEVINEWMRSFQPKDWKGASIVCFANSVLGGISSTIDQFRNQTCVSPSLRKSLIAVTCGVGWNADGKKRQDLVDKIDKWANEKLKPTGVDQFVYWNEPQHNFISNSDWQNSYWGGESNYLKLLQIKDKYDPNLTFTCYHCVGWEKVQNVDPAVCPDDCTCSNQKEVDVCAYSSSNFNYPTTSKIFLFVFSLAIFFI